MTESNINDRRFWMVISLEKKSGDTVLVPSVVHDDQGKYIFSDDKDAARLADNKAAFLCGDGVFVVEAISKYSLPEPRVVKQNLHIPPLTPRGESNE